VSHSRARGTRFGSEGVDVLGGRRPVLECLKAGQPVQRVLVARELDPSPVIGEIRRRAERSSVEVAVVPRDEIERVACGIKHQGVVALTARYRYTPLDAILRPRPAGVLFLDGVMDPHNVGSLLRSADGAGFGGVVLRAHRAAGVTAAARRVSAGASEVVPVARVANMSHALDEARVAGLWIVGFDRGAQDDLWSSPLMDPPVGVLLGAEDRGISKVARGHCDAFVRIPSHGRLGSLNVASAGAIAMFEVARRRARPESPSEQDSGHRHDPG
jgi:23S rRNA (guanosine2251-2'-O)-methyltransferase